MSEILGFAGLNDLDVTLEKVRLLGYKFTFTGTVANAGTLTVVFTVRDVSNNVHYRYSIEGNTVTANLINDAAVTIALAKGHDPVKWLVGGLKDTAGSYTVDVTYDNGSKTASLGPYTYTYLNNNINTSTVINKLTANKAKFTSQSDLMLSDLTGVKVELFLNGSVQATIIFA
jgi:hypothetical protein